MADSNVSVIPGISEQAATETEIRLDKPAVPENSEISFPDVTDQEAALAPEGEAARRETGEEQLEPPAPADIGGEHVSDPSEVVVPIEKGRKTAKAVEKEAAEKAPAPEQQSGKKAVHRGRQPKTEKEQKPLKSIGPAKTAEEKSAPAKKEIPAPEPEQPPVPQEAPRSNEPEKIVYLNLSELHAFKNHPFQVRDDADMEAMVESVKAGGVNQPAIVRPRADGGYEIVSGHRRQRASELAGFADMPCIVRNLSDDEAILKMAEDNINQRKEMLASERSKMLKMQLDAIKHQGARESSGQIDPKDAGKRSNEIVA